MIHQSIFSCGVNVLLKWLPITMSNSNSEACLATTLLLRWKFFILIKHFFIFFYFITDGQEKRNLCELCPLEVLMLTLSKQWKRSVIEDRTDNKGKQERRPPVLLCETAISGDTQWLHSAANTGHFVISTQNEIKQQDDSVQQFNHTERQKDSWLWTHYVMLETAAWHFYVHLFLSLPSLLN